MRYYDHTEHECGYKREVAYLKGSLDRAEEQLNYYKEELNKLYRYRVAVESLAEVIHPLRREVEEDD